MPSRDIIKSSNQISNVAGALAITALLAGAATGRKLPALYSASFLIGVCAVEQLAALTIERETALLGAEESTLTSLYTLTGKAILPASIIIGLTTEKSSLKAFCAGAAVAAVDVATHAKRLLQEQEQPNANAVIAV